MTPAPSPDPAPARPPRRRLALLPVVLAVVLALAAACGTASGAVPEPDAQDRSRLSDVRLYVDPDSGAARQVTALRQAGQTAPADRVQSRIAGLPIARWFAGPQQGDPFQQAQALSRAAAASGTAAVITVYDLPGRDCGQYSSGGADSDAAYVQYVGALAAGLGDRAAVVVLEPDAVPHSMQGCGDPVRTRQLLRQAVDILVRQPHVRVYLDAGNATWVSDLDRLAAALRDSDVGRTAGFALNTSNFSATQDSAAYGRGLSDRLDGAHFVIDTSRNGAGAPSSSGAVHSWCNPPGRRLGPVPTTTPDLPRVDALLWVKTPGDSDGTCTPGAPPAGQWWQQLADDLMS